MNECLTIPWMFNYYFGYWVNIWNRCILYIIPFKTIHSLSGIELTSARHLHHWSELHALLIPPLQLTTHSRLAPEYLLTVLLLVILSTRCEGSNSHQPGTYTTDLNCTHCLSHTLELTTHSRLAPEYLLTVLLLVKALPVAQILFLVNWTCRNTNYEAPVCCLRLVVWTIQGWLCGRHNIRTARWAQW